MHVALIASTVLHNQVPDTGDLVINDWMQVEDDSATHADVLAEFAGRSCYQAFHKPREATRANTDYLANILAQGHESVLEHASATFYVTGVSRALTHELIRHRHLSYSELSQRFVNVGDADPVTPPALQLDGVDFPTTGHAGADEALYGAFQDAQTSYAELVDFLTETKGLKRKQAREAARAVMPNATETRIVVTGNMRAWRDVIKKRYSEHADAEIRSLAGLILQALRAVAPHTVQDLPDSPSE